MKNAVIIFFVMAAATGCSSRKIDKVVVNYTSKEVYDSTEFNKPGEIRVFENFMDAKVRVNEKFQSLYSLTVRYSDGKTAEFFGNGPLIRNGDTYTVNDAALKREYTDLINAGMNEASH